MQADFDVVLGRLAVELLSGRPPDLQRGIDEAARRKLGGLFAFGLSALGIEHEQPGGAARARLERAARQETADDLLVAKETGEVLTELGSKGLRPVVLKGRALALSVWPRPAFRPAGDLDLLIEEESLGVALDALLAAGYRRPSCERASQLASEPYSIELAPGNGGLLVVDLHTRLFRSVGGRIDARRLLGRSRPTALDGHPVRELDDADRLLFMLVHAAKHGARRLKWLLDLYAIAQRTDQDTWRRAARRAAACGVRRPFFAAVDLVAALPGVAVEAELLEALRPPLLTRKLLGALVTRAGAVREKAPARWERYAFELLMEESLSARARMAGAFLQKLVRGLLGARG